MSTYTIFTAPRHNSRHWRRGEVTWEQITAWVESPASTKKDAGAYLLGEMRKTTRDHTTGQVALACTQYHRTADAVTARSVLTLDADYADPSLPDDFATVTPWRALIHTTFSSTPTAPRYRILVPLSREVTPDEYAMLADVVMRDLGWRQFDLTAAQPERYMFLPAAEDPEAFDSWVHDGEVLDVVATLRRYDPDLRRVEMPTPPKAKRDPRELDGVVGAFNRVYEIPEAIETYRLPYVPAGEDRWTYTEGHGEGGLGLMTGGTLAFSHHSTDPAGGEAVSAFDLVRLHRFGHLDTDPDAPLTKRASYAEMLRLAEKDDRVLADIVGADFDVPAPEAGEEPPERDWRLGLRINARDGKMRDEIANWDLIRDHDPAFASLCFNELSMTIETTGDLPWRPLSQGGAAFGSSDRVALAHYLERAYHVRASQTFVDGLVDTHARKRWVDPLRDYLEGLRWDGTPRVETSLPGVRSTPYTRVVARKCLVAAVARVLNPGVKWDHTLVLYGPEARGKTWWIDRMARGYSAGLGRISDKDTLLALHRNWIMVADEGHSLRKADADDLKSFLTKTYDVFRLPYERETLQHKRRCVIWSTTNDATFLRRQEGNRRFLIVHCEDRVDFELFSDDAYVDQIWAEAVHLYREGELLFLDEREVEAAATVREMFTEEDALGGLIAEYVDARYPVGWEDWSLDERTSWLLGDRSDGVVPLTHVCSTQVWVEVLGRRLGDAKRMDLLDITAALRRLPGWRPMVGRHRTPAYGPQMTFERDGGDLL